MEKQQTGKYDNLEKIMQEDYLDQRLMAYGSSDYYPFHMPGHKRQMEMSFHSYEIDITEIDGFDNLHDAHEILKNAQQRAADLYGAKSSYFLINGSTCGILAAISATVKKGGKILIARNCHKAVYHGAYLRELSVKYVYPVINEFGIQGQIMPEDIRQALSEENDIEAVVITSPTYDGIVSDIREIAGIVHEHGIPLIVDEAHGAHFGFHSYFPETAVRLGADIVIQSMHKTLPSLTQTALLHVCTSRVDEARVQRFLGIYETSSPSYVLMAGMERCIRMMSQQKDILFADFADRLADFYRKASCFSKIEVLDMGKSGVTYDASKILITAGKLGLDGRQLYDILLNDYHLQMEMCSGSYVLAMTSFMDKKEAYERLLASLADIETRYGEAAGAADYGEDKYALGDFIARVYGRSSQKMELAGAWDTEWEEISLDEAKGRIAAGFVNLYPPGIPLLVPGEVITENMIRNLKECVHRGLTVQGINIYTSHSSRTLAISGNLGIKVVN